MNLKIQTPVSQLLDESVKSVTLSTESGNIQILAGHQNLLSKLTVGLVIVVTENTGQRSFLLNAGLVRVQNDIVEISSVDGYEITERKFVIDSYKDKMVQKSKSINIAIEHALNNQEYYVQSYLFDEERLAKFELLQELIKGS